MNVAVRALYFQAVLADRREMRPARDEKDIVPGNRQPRAEISADSTGRHDRNAHAFRSLGSRATLSAGGRATKPSVRKGRQPLRE